MALPSPLTSFRCEALGGEVSPPGDKSISHRSIILGGIAGGTTKVRGLLESDDVLCTVASLRAMGAKIWKEQDVWHIKGVGASGLRAPKEPLNLGNSGTSARLLMGLVAGNGFSARFLGDESLSRRPMGRVIEPLSLMGARFEATKDGLPLTLTGTQHPKPITYTLPVASAQVKSAILLAALNAKGLTTVIEPAPTRDHTENMLRTFGAPISVEKRGDGADIISITCPCTLYAQNIDVPADPSSAAFPIVAALLRPDSRLCVKNVGINPRRAGLFEVLRQMGGKIDYVNRTSRNGEPVADVAVNTSALSGIDVPADRAPSMIDEYPILAIAAACATGATRMRGLQELRVKESDRLSLIVKGLSCCGVKAGIEGNDLIVQGTGAAPPGGATVLTAMDHRIAMSFLVLGLCTTNPVTIDDGAFIATSFPGFVDLMNKLGAKILSCRS